MILKLNDTYQISTDNKNVALEELKVIKDGERKGEKYWSNIGYYPNFKWAIEGCLKHGLMNSDIEGLQEIQNYLYQLRADIIDKCELLEFEVAE
ncbi:MAG TPA: hypothetical protein VIK78_19535 [Ruminiclostridium sp.]